MATVDEFTVDEVDDDEDDPNIIENEDLEEDFDKNEEYYDLGQKQDNLNESSIKKEEEDQIYEDAFDHNLIGNFGEENVIKSHNETDIGVIEVFDFISKKLIIREIEIMIIENFIST